MSYVAANALADLIVEPKNETAMTRLPFVHHSSPRWEFEPLRWLGINSVLGAASWADRVESQHHRESRAGRWIERFLS